MPQFLKKLDLEALGIDYSDQSLRRLEAAGKFPRRVKGVGTGPAWSEDAIKKYLEDKIAAVSA